jgi:hypothetical protein
MLQCHGRKERMWQQIQTVGSSRVHRVLASESRFANHIIFEFSLAVELLRNSTALAAVTPRRD